MSRAKYVFTLDDLQRLLGLPSDVQVVDVWDASRDPRVISVLVESPRFHTNPASEAHILSKDGIMARSSVAPDVDVPEIFDRHYREIPDAE